MSQVICVECGNDDATDGYVYCSDCLETGLFDMEATPLLEGDKVVVQTMWGDEEATVRRLTVVDGFPYAEVRTSSGDTVSLNVARLVRLKSCVACGGNVHWQECPTGGWWIHREHPEDNHDAEVLP